jgi:cytochrome c oxidase subunit I
MSAIATPHDAASPPAGRRRALVPSIVSGLVLGVVGAIVVGIIVHGLASPDRRADATVTAGFAAWFVFFMIGIGAPNYLFRWGLGRPDPTHEEELELAGKGQGTWRYFRFCTDHKVVGIQYLVTILVLFAVGGLASWMIRLEQMQSGAKVFTPATYNTIVGMHGLVMIATTIIMVSASFGNYILPIMLGADDMAFPRLNALSYWTLFTAIPVLLSTVVLGGFSTGWTGYSPLADQAAMGMDAYCFTIIVFGLSIAMGAMNIFVTVLKMRAPGMTWSRVPTFVWAVVLSTMLGLLVFPMFSAATLLTLLDRVFGTSFYEANLGGNNFLYEQLFWFMGHPEVYVIALPSIGVIAEVITVFSRKPLFGQRLVIGGMFGIFTLSVVVWMHHIYWSGANTPIDLPTMLDTELISIPTGLVFLAIVGTLWRGRIRLEAPMLFALGFIVNFLIGGVTGLYLADVPTDTIYHGGMFVVAHFHFTLVGGGVFGFLTGFYYWFPKMTGRQLDARLSKLHFWLFEIGFVGVFMPLFFAGIKGEPRWQAYIDPEFGTNNLISSLFVIFIIASVAVFGYNILISWLRGELAEANPWGGRTLEWVPPSPVPLVNFERPVVVSAGPYDYGMGGPRMMGAPAIAGAAVNDAVAASHVPHSDPATRGSMARWGAATMITSWTMFALAVYLGYLYLDALNTQGAFKPSSEHAPATAGTVLLTVGALAGAAVWSWGYRVSRSGDAARALPAMALGWLLSLAGLIASVVFFLNYNAPLPLHAYASSMDLFVLFHGWHLVIALVIGALPLGRLARGRIAGREYVIQIVGWWLWYSAITAVLMMVLTLAVK